MTLPKLPARVAPVLALVSILLIPSFSRADPMSERIFGLVSLGEPVDTVVGRMGEPDVRRKNLLGWYHRGPGSGVSIIVHDKRVAAVAASYLRPSWIQFRRLERLLTEKHGRPQNLDFFPYRASTTTQKVSAILSGKGRAARRWRAPAYTVRLFWMKPHSMFLRYDHSSLWKAYRDGKEKKGERR